MKLKEYLGLQDFYLAYRFKKARIEGNKVFQPYVKQKDSSTHEYSLFYNEWKIVIETFWNIVFDELLKGNPFNMPRNLGMLELIKVKYRYPIEGNKNKLGRLLHTQGYAPRIAWYRYKHAQFLHKMWYHFNLSRKIQWSKISKKLFEDPSIIYNLND